MKVSTLLTSIFLILLISVSILSQKESEIKMNKEVSQYADFENYDDEIVFAPSYRPLKIFYKPRPAYPKSEGGTICVQGTVTLLVEFLATSEIGDVKPVSELGYGLTEKAIEAARNMKFTPLIKNGIPTSVVKAVQFSFTIY